MEKGNVPQIAIGCYGGRRGLTLASLVKAILRKNLGEDYEKRIKIYGVGHPKFSKGGKVSEHHRQALQTLRSPYATEAGNQLEETERRAITPEEIDQMDAVYAVDNFIQGEYRKLSQNGGGHIQLVTDGSGVYHGKWGADLDDTEMPLKYTIDYFVPMKQKKPIAPGVPTTPGESEWHSLDGQVFKAGTPEARAQEARDLVQIAEGLAKNLILKHNLKN